jgi:hypothetical protein
MIRLILVTSGAEHLHLGAYCSGLLSGSGGVMLMLPLDCREGRRGLLALIFTATYPVTTRRYGWAAMSPDGQRWALKDLF